MFLELAVNFQFFQVILTGLFMESHRGRASTSAGLVHSEPENNDPLNDSVVLTRPLIQRQTIYTCSSKFCVVFNCLCLFTVCSGYSPESNKGKSKSHKHIKRDEVVLFDNVKEYSRKPGKWSENKMKLSYIKNSLYLTRKYALIFGPRTLSVPRSEQWALRNT